MEGLAFRVRVRLPLQVARVRRRAPRGAVHRIQRRTELGDRQGKHAREGPLPAIGGFGRFYVIPEVAINFELTGFKVPDVDARYSGNYFDWNIHGTFNVNDYVGMQVGWRRMTTFLNIDNDLGDTKFQGIWFGGVVRY